MDRFLEAFCERLGLHKLDKVPYLKVLVEKTGIIPSKVAAAIIGLIVFHMFTEHGTRWISSILGFCYPAYATAKLLKETSDEKEEEGKFWLKYWLVYGLVYLTETVIINFLVMIPHYYVIRVIFLVWLYHSETQGALICYEKTVKVMLQKYEMQIDKKLATFQRFDSQRVIRTAVSTVTKEVAKAVVSAA